MSIELTYKGQYRATNSTSRHTSAKFCNKYLGFKFSSSLAAALLRAALRLYGAKGFAKIKTYALLVGAIRLNYVQLPRSKTVSFEKLQQCSRIKNNLHSSLSTPKATSRGASHMSEYIKCKTGLANVFVLTEPHTAVSEILSFWNVTKLKMESKSTHHCW